MNPKLTIHPECRSWPRLIERRDTGELFGHLRREWREETRRELGLATDRPVIATGHQTLLWHPGILVKYLLTDAIARAHSLSTANLVVDQHAGGYGEYDVPVRRTDGSLAVRRIELTPAPADEPMALHPPFTPPKPPRHIHAALPSVGQGIERIHEAAYAHRDAATAAMQMAQALADLMRPWVAAMPNVTATDLVETSLSRAIAAEMVRDPRRCAEAYNEAVTAFPEAGIGKLLIRDDYVELPLWRIRDDRRRMHAYDNDVADWLDRSIDGPRLMPRALFMTALVRLGMCDLFVHGTGGANYDRAMERWIGNWLGVQPSAIAIASADVFLPLRDPGEPAIDSVEATLEARRVWHDPEPTNGEAPGPVKRELLEAIEQAPSGSLRRRKAFFSMHKQLDQLRGVHGGVVEQAQRRAERAHRQQKDASIAQRRDWAFPLYTDEQISELAAAVADAAALRGDYVEPDAARTP
jgi:hypothetical protein